MNNQIVIDKTNVEWIAVLKEYCPLALQYTGKEIVVRADSYSELQKNISHFVDEVNKNI